MINRKAMLGILTALNASTSLVSVDARDLHEARDLFEQVATTAAPRQLAARTECDRKNKEWGVTEGKCGLRCDKDYERWSGSKKRCLKIGQKACK